jgi:hypothetical protein
MPPDNRLRSHDALTPGGKGPHRGAVTLHECPRPGCTTLLGPSKFLCGTDWELVPKELRDEIWRTWDRKRGLGTPAHEIAIAAAVESLSALDGAR